MSTPTRVAGLVFSMLLLAACGNSPSASARPPGNEGGGDGGDGGTGGGEGGTGGVPLTCGDGDLDEGELCDEGEGNSDTEPDACRSDCTPARCGDGVEDTGEDCDQGTLNSDVAPDACRTTCVVPTCGDGVRDTPEGCDDGALNSDTEPDACRVDCVPAGCNDGVLDDGEECDLGPENSDTARDGCRTNCRYGYCGDGVIDTGESCDDGPDNGNAPDACRRTCIRAHCGDGVHDTPEGCDDGPDNSDTRPDACRTACVLPRCGDGVPDAGEACDAGAANSDTVPDACRAGCALAGCGDGVTDTGEACDAGLANSDTVPDACRTSCARAGCGDGVPDAGEACDAGAANSDTTPDACRTACVLPACGDGVTDAGEACDAGPGNSATAPDACRPGCLLPSCGDGVHDTGEECDDGGHLPNDGCSAACVLEPAICGNGVREAPFEECDDANLYDGDGCSHLCDWEIPAVCGGAQANPVIDLRVAGTSDGNNGFLYSRNTQYDLATAASRDCGGAGPEAFHGYVIPIAGNLVVDLTVPTGGTLNPVLAVRRVCGQVATELGCAPLPAGSGLPGEARRLVIPNVDPAWGPVYVHVDGFGATSGAYDLHVRVLPPLAAGAACAVDGSAGPCPANTTCADPDGDGAGACVPVVAGGAACDPAGVANECAAGFYCPAGAAPVCTPNCGNGWLDAGEECDDGNAVAGDNCSPACLQAGTGCAAPYDLNLAWSATTRTADWSDDTTTHSSQYAGSCGATATQKDAVASFTAPVAGTYSFVLRPTGFDGVLYLWDGACGTGVERSCTTTAGYGGTETVLATLAQNQTVYVVVDGNSASFTDDGPFHLTVSQPICGDGVLQPPEECDDGNTAPGDNCGPTCLEAGDDCASPWHLAWDATAGRATWSSTTVGRGAEYWGSCASASAGTNDAVARFVAPAAGTYSFQVDASWNAAVWLWGAVCGQSSTVLSCAGARSAAIPEVVTATLAAGEAVHVVVDSYVSGTSGPFTLAVRRVACGDGVRVAPEECDDGNVVAGDGCDASCLTETLLETEPNDTRGMATPAIVGRTYRGAIDPAADYDYYAFAATAGTSYTFETFVGAIDDCTATVGGTSADTRIRIYDVAGTQLGDDDDGGLGGVGRCSLLEWTAPTTATYYLLVRHYSETAPTRITPYFVELRSP